MVAMLGYQPTGRSFKSTSRDRDLQLMVQVGPHARALFAAEADSAGQAAYTLTGIAEQYAKQEKVTAPNGTSFSSCFESFNKAAAFSSGTVPLTVTEPKPPRGFPSGGKPAVNALERGGSFNGTSLLIAPALAATAAHETAVQAAETDNTTSGSASGSGQLRVCPISMSESRSDSTLAKELITLRSSDLAIYPISMSAAPLENTSTMDQFLNHKLAHHLYKNSHNAVTQYFLNVLPPIGFYTSDGGKCCTNSHHREVKEAAW